ACPQIMDEVHIGLEIDFLDRYAVDDFSLDVLDAVDARTDRILPVGGDAPLHLGRAETRVLPNDAGDRDGDLREDVDRHGPQRADPQEYSQRGEDIKGVRPPQGEANNPRLTRLRSRLWPQPGCADEKGSTRWRLPA